ncbi:hypothetical protein COHA_010159 [Chlorella ohadii]|uniref:Methyltransferase type 11 domain-containing protein n=1 Tax=Chlorella ohadii TaxID=2649997 RepID=A0AAD5DDD8_9CHLO|nr:hypothetical protein COHA_010159 [Chlorella ohadii]
MNTASRLPPFPATYDELDGGAAAESLGFPALRQQLLAQARGDVLETAVGTGLNLPLYDLESGALASLSAIDLSGGMLAQARRRAQQLGLGERTRLELVQADVEQLQAALGGRQFDTVVDTFSLCVFPDPLAALRSMAACLRPGGTLLLLEHSRSGFGPLAAYQDLTAPAVAATGKGCRWNDDVPGLVAAAGLEVQRLEAHVGGLIVSLSAVKPAQPA